MALPYDVLDFDPVAQERWTMAYRDGTQRRAQYRFDLIRDRENTRLTEKAARYWPDSGMPILGDDSLQELGRLARARSGQQP